MCTVTKARRGTSYGTSPVSLSCLFVDDRIEFTKGVGWRSAPRNGCPRAAALINYLSSVKDGRLTGSEIRDNRCRMPSLVISRGLTLFNRIVPQGHGNLRCSMRLNSFENRIVSFEAVLIVLKSIFFQRLVGHGLGNEVLQGSPQCFNTSIITASEGGPHTNHLDV